MGRLTLPGLAAFFLLYGFASGVAFLVALESCLREERSRTLAAVYFSLPPRALTEVRI